MKDRLIKEYSELARAYDRNWSTYTKATLTETIKRIKLQPSDKVLDLGCGTGKLLLKLSEIYPDVDLHGIDPVSEMLNIARTKLKLDVNLVSGWSDNLPYDNQFFDFVISISVFHFIDEPHRSLTEINRVLKNGGKLIITDWCDDFLTTRLITYYIKAMNKAHFKTYSLYELSELLSEKGFSLIYGEKYKIDPIWGLLTIKGIKNRLEK